MHVSLSSVRGTVLSAMFVAFSTPVVFAQTTGRSVSLIAPPVVAATASFEVTFPPAYSISSFNILGWWTISEYSPTALPVPLPWQNQGLYRGGALIALIPWSAGPVSNAARLDLAVPPNPLLAGYAFDLQTIDLTLPGGVWTASWSDNDLEMTIAPGCASTAPAYNPLYPVGTPQDPDLQFDTGTALVTKFADRARMRHARDNASELGPFLPSNVSAGSPATPTSPAIPPNPNGATVLAINNGTQYDLWKDNYWHQRVVHAEIEDRVGRNNGTDITFRVKSFARHTSTGTAAPYQPVEWRFFYDRGAEPTNASTFMHNPGPAIQETSLPGGNPSTDPNAHPNVNAEWTYEYTLNFYQAANITRPLQLGDEIEFEISQFMMFGQPPPPNAFSFLQAGTQSNYYGSTFMYVVGEGLRPWYASEVETNTPGPDGRISYESDAIPEIGRLGGDTTLHYTYSGETEWRYKQAVPNLAPDNTWDFFNGRRLHHTGFDSGNHSEPNNAPIINPQTNLTHAGDLGPNYTANACITCHFRNNRAVLPPVGGELEKFVISVAADQTGTTPHPTLGDTLSPRSVNDPQQWQVDAALASSLSSFTSAPPPQLVPSNDPLSPGGDVVIYDAYGQYSLHGALALAHATGNATYDIEVRYNSALGANMKFEEVGGVALYTTLQLPPTQGWQTYSTTVSLPASIQLALAYDATSAGAASINWLRLTEQLPPGTPLSEGTVTLDAMAPYDDGHNQYGDGTPYQLRRPVLRFSGVTPNFYSMRLAQPLIGLGLLEAVDEATILGFADPCDSDNDGVSGRAAITAALGTNQPRIGRFNWKGIASSIGDQIAYALNRDMGVTTSRFPILDGASAPSPVEVSDSELDQLVHYNGLLGVNARRSLHDADALAGEQLFSQMGCVACHVPQMTTGTTHPWAEVRNQTIRPFTDLLLHDMGAGLADNMAVAGSGASASEWRTTPLWGIGLSAGIDGREGYLHDGRAATMEEAILWHGGEAETAKQAFRTSSTSDRAKLIAFLRSL